MSSGNPVKVKKKRRVELGRSTMASLGVALAGVLLSLGAAGSGIGLPHPLDTILMLTGGGLAVIAALLFWIADKKESEEAVAEQTDLKLALALLLEVSSSKRGLVERLDPDIAGRARLHSDVLAPGLFNRSDEGPAELRIKDRN